LIVFLLKRTKKEKAGILLSVKGRTDEAIIKKNPTTLPHQGDEDNKLSKVLPGSERKKKRNLKRALPTMPLTAQIKRPHSKNVCEKTASMILRRDDITGGVKGKKNLVGRERFRYSRFPGRDATSEVLKRNSKGPGDIRAKSLQQ